MSDPILNMALQELHNVGPNLERAKKYVKILAEAGHDVTDQRAQIAELEVKRQKNMDVLKANGATLPSTDKASS